MLYARRFPKKKKTGPKKKDEGKQDSFLGSEEINSERISEARKLLKHELDADLVADVLAGVTRLDNGVKKANHPGTWATTMEVSGPRLWKARHRRAGSAAQ